MVGFNLLIDFDWFFFVTFDLTTYAWCVRTVRGNLYSNIVKDSLNTIIGNKCANSFVDE